MTIPDFTISGLTVIDGKANQSGNRLLASFNVDLSVITLAGCVLIEKGDCGTVRVGGPNGKTTAGKPVSAHFTDPAFARAVSRRAAMVYAACTGRELSDD